MWLFLLSVILMFSPAVASASCSWVPEFGMCPAQVCAGDEMDLCVQSVCKVDEMDLCGTSACDADEMDLCNRSTSFAFVSEVCSANEMDLCDVCGADEMDVCDEPSTGICDTDEMDLCHQLTPGDFVEVCSADEMDLCDEQVTGICGTDEMDLCDEPLTGICDTDEMDLCHQLTPGDLVKVCSADEMDLCDESCGTDAMDLCPSPSPSPSPTPSETSVPEAYCASPSLPENAKPWYQENRSYITIFYGSCNLGHVMMLTINGTEFKSMFFEASCKGNAQYRWIVSSAHFEREAEESNAYPNCQAAPQSYTCDASVVDRALDYIGASAGASPPSASTCSAPMQSGEECHAICKADAIVVGTIRCDQGSLMGESACHPSSVKKIKTIAVYGKTQIRVNGALTEETLKAALVAALSSNGKPVHQRQITVKWSLVNTVRRLSSTDQEAQTYLVSYEVTVRDGGPSATKIRSSAAEMADPISDSSKAFVGEMQEKGVTVDPASIQIVSYPAVVETEKAVDPNDEIIETTQSVLPDPQPTAKPSDEDAEGKTNWGALVGGIVGGVAGLVVLCASIVWSCKRYRYSSLAKDEKHAAQASNQIPDLEDQAAANPTAQPTPNQPKSTLNQSSTKQKGAAQASGEDSEPTSNKAEKTSSTPDRPSDKPPAKGEDPQPTPEQTEKNLSQPSAKRKGQQTTTNKSTNPQPAVKQPTSKPPPTKTDPELSSPNPVYSAPPEDIPPDIQPLPSRENTFLIALRTQSSGDDPPPALSYPAASPKEEGAQLQILDLEPGAELQTTLEQIRLGKLGSISL